jgi:hypothetical protein
MKSVAQFAARSLDRNLYSNPMSADFRRVRQAAKPSLAQPASPNAPAVKHGV